MSPLGISNLRSPARRPRTGLGLVEALISLAIASALLTAVAAAFSATVDAMEENDKFFQATHSGRIALHRILTQVRRGLVDENSTVSNVRLLTETGQDITYRYDSTDKQIEYITNTVTTDPDYVLARNMESCQFSIEMGTDHEGNPCVARVSMVLTVKVGNNQLLLSGTAAPRRNFSF
jgi:type II secretory pathway pseudopilin PulG